MNNKLTLFCILSLSISTLSLLGMNGQIKQAVPHQPQLHTQDPITHKERCSLSQVYNSIKKTIIQGWTDRENGRVWCTLCYTKKLPCSYHRLCKQKFD